MVGLWEPNKWTWDEYRDPGLDCDAEIFQVEQQEEQVGQDIELQVRIEEATEGATDQMISVQFKKIFLNSHQNNIGRKTGGKIKEKNQKGMEGENDVNPLRGSAHYSQAL
ncbi:hypothetical protein BOTCAL_0311g00090 [Botryotinia calthae]|uniref:Uncharacterized protein n=1 Tax=Botryotinia calthae TaxID=38488 RepID=A0A4Y8CWP7_9HELO|nr:hypothetical protein BOTCAL_0311g00090 [Botryotinia calthae]